MPQNRKVIYTQGVPIAADFNASDGAPICVDQSTGVSYYITSGGTVTPLTVATVATGISAAGTTQGTATALTAGTNYVSTVASGAGVVLLGLTAGSAQTVYNAGANTLKVYPPTGSKINQLAANAATLLPINTGCRYEVVSATQIVAILSA